MSRTNRSKYALLGALSLGPKSGYDVRKFFAASVGNFWQESYGQIYPLLRELVAAGEVEAVAAPATSGTDRGRPGRDRRVYAITERGHARLAVWVSEPAEPSVLRIEILLKLFFARQGDADAVRRLVRAFRDAQQAQLAHYARVDADLAVTAAGAPDLPYWRVTLDYGRRTGEALVAWADATLAVLDAAVDARGPDPARPAGTDSTG